MVERVPAPPWKPWQGSIWIRYHNHAHRIPLYWITLLEPMPDDSLRWRAVVRKMGCEDYDIVDNYQFPIRNVTYERID